MRNGFAAIKRTIPTAIAVFAACFALLCGCGAAEKQSFVRISFVDSVFYSVEKPVAEVPYGNDFSTVVTVRDGYELSSCSYDGYQTRVENGQTVLVLQNVTRPQRVTVKAVRSAAPPVKSLRCTVEYRFNGGSLRDESGDARTVECVTEHLRPNTWNGVGLTKSGYTLYGWNTRADGGGEHIGLGSRVTAAEGEKLTLYAEWLEQIAAGQFLYKELSHGECAVTGYRGAGDVQPFVIPDVINGLRVVEIASSFTMNMPCGALTAKTLVLPNTVRVVKGNSFLNSSFEELCFSDNIETIDEAAFPYNLKTYRINAAMRPCFQDKNNSTIFSDNMDRLILNADKKKLIFFSGCSFSYGLNSRTVDEAFDGEYVVFNMGMNGDINGAFQMEIMLPFIGENDVFVHSPEQMSKCQLMASFFTNDMMFIMTEGNYDLLTFADFSGNGGVIRAFFDYIELKREADECDYSASRYEDFNIYGDYIFERPYDESTEAQRDVTYSDDVYCYEPAFLTENGIAKLAGYYDVVRDRGGEVFLSYAPVNISAREAGEVERIGLEYAEKFESMLRPYGYASVSDVKDYMFAGRYFYDSDYHLNDIGAALRTERLISDLRSAGVGAK